MFLLYLLEVGLINFNCYISFSKCWLLYNSSTYTTFWIFAYFFLLTFTSRPDSATLNHFYDTHIDISQHLILVLLTISWITVVSKSSNSLILILYKI